MSTYKFKAKGTAGTIKTTMNGVVTADTMEIALALATAECKKFGLTPDNLVLSKRAAPRSKD